jgi:hypothetical protein
MPILDEELYLLMRSSEAQLAKYLSERKVFRTKACKEKWSINCCIQYAFPVVLQFYRQLNNCYATRTFSNLYICGLVVRVRGYRTEMCCDSCEVRTEFIYIM